MLRICCNASWRVIAFSLDLASSMASLEKRPFSRLKIVKIILFVLFGTVTHYLPKLTKERAIKKELPVFPFTGSLYL